MGIEIEYRFLLAARPSFNVAPVPITQGYLSADPDKVVRVRRIGDEGKLTIKGRKQGASGLEFEYDIPLDHALQILELCGADNTLDKDRYEISAENGLTWEVDVFKGRHQGLVIAELEVPDLHTDFNKPGWLNGVDITEDTRFANAILIGTTRDELIRNIHSVLAPAGIEMPSIQP